MAEAKHEGYPNPYCTVEEIKSHIEKKGYPQQAYRALKVEAYGFAFEVPVANISFKDYSDVSVVGLRITHKEAETIKEHLRAYR